MPIPPPETILVESTRVKCDGSGEIPSALGHPRVFLEIDEHGYVDCGYCDRRFVLSHDEMYERFDEIWPEVLAFMRSGRFSDEMSRTPPDGDPFARRRS